ncbi:MAG: DUF4402 domain-containing protein [Perlabentimonas sp.]
MKKSIMLFAAIVMVAGFSTSLMAQTENTAVGAKILTAMTITESAPMHFGTMTVPTAATTVVLATDGTVTVGSGTTTLLAQAPISTAAAYDITGDVSATYAITIDASTIIANTALDEMTVDNFVCSYAGLTSTLDAGGADNFTVGATLNLVDAQPAGTYAGTFDVTVAYN